MSRTCCGIQVPLHQCAVPVPILEQRGRARGDRAFFDHGAEDKINSPSGERSRRIELRKRLKNPFLPAILEIGLSAEQKMMSKESRHIRKQADLLTCYPTTRLENFPTASLEDPIVTARRRQSRAA
jgi:hypothetical protein